MSECIFCKIAAKVIPAQIVYEDDLTVAFNDLNPQAPVHILLIPKKHLDHIDHAAADDEVLLGKLLMAASKIAGSAGIAQSGYRVVTNIGADGGQTVGHLHLHILGGRHLSWPPG
jgi:histidine triad (HIT) family protein